jgi:hypothetical protein
VYSPASVSWEHEHPGKLFYKRGHALTSDNVYKHDGHKRCKACKRLRARYYKKLDPFHGNKSRKSRAKAKITAQNRLKLDTVIDVEE